jgi:hypothetical protein
MKMNTFYLNGVDEVDRSDLAGSDFVVACLEQLPQHILLVLVAVRVRHPGVQVRLTGHRL